MKGGEVIGVASMAELTHGKRPEFSEQTAIPPKEESRFSNKNGTSSFGIDAHQSTAAKKYHRNRREAVRPELVS